NLLRLSQNLPKNCFQYYLSDFFGAFFAATVFFGVAFLAAGFFFSAKAVLSCAVIHFFTSSRVTSAKSSAVYFSSSLVFGILKFVFPNLIKGPQRPFSIEIFSFSHCCI